MAKLGINTGSTPNDGTGDTLLAAALKINQNFTEIYTTFGDGSNLSGVVTSLVGYATEGYVNNAIVGIVTSGALSGYATQGYVNNALVGYATEGYVDNAILGIGTVTGGSSQWVTTAAGIHTLSNVGVGTTNPTSALTVKGNTSLETLNVSGVSTFQNDVKVAEYSYGTNSNQIILGNNKFRIYADGSNTYLKNFDTNTGGDLYIESDAIIIRKYDGTETIAQFTEGAGVQLNYQGIKKFETIGAGVTVSGTTFTNQLSVSGVSTFNNNVRVSGIVTANSFLVSNDGGNNGSLLIEDTGSYSQLSFRASNGTTQAQIQGVEGNLYIYSGLNGYTSLSNATGNIFYPDGSVILNNGYQGTTLICNQVHVQSGITSFYNNVSVGGTISVDGGVKLATNNATIVGTSGTVGEIKRIGGAPFFYDGTAWREFVLSSGTPVSVPADTEWDDVILRSTFDTNFDDVRFNVSPTVSSGSTITQSSVKIGTGSLRLQNGYLTYPHRSEYNFTGEWTIEGWFYIDTLPTSTGSASDVIFSKGNAGTSGNNFALGLEYAGISNLYNFYWKNNASPIHNGSRGTVIAQYAGTNLIQQWIHIALVREPSNGSIHFYLNGIEHGSTASNAIIDNDIPNTSTNDMYLGYYQDFTDSRNFDGYVDDFRISTVARYTSVGITTTTTFTPPTTALPTTGTLSSYIQPPADKYGEISLGVSPTWRGTSGVTVSRQASGNYRVSFASSYTNSNDYYVLSQGMDQGFASYVGIARSTTHVDISINRLDNDATIDSGSLSVQIKNHI
jgi:hypothetical protein